MAIVDYVGVVLARHRWCLRSQEQFKKGWGEKNKIIIIKKNHKIRHNWLLTLVVDGENPMIIHTCLCCCAMTEMNNLWTLNKMQMQYILKLNLIAFVPNFLTLPNLLFSATSCLKVSPRIRKYAASISAHSRREWPFCSPFLHDKSSHLFCHIAM